jgi:Profilin
MAWAPHAVQIQTRGEAKTCVVLIVGLDGVVWGTSPATEKTEKTTFESDKKCFADPSTLLAGGPTINGIKYMCTKADSTTFILKKGENAIAAAKAAKCWVVAMANAGANPNALYNVAYAGTEYMASIGF